MAKRKKAKSLVKGPEHSVLGAAVRETRARRGMSQEMLGLYSGLHRNYVGAIERGEINPKFRILRKVATGLNVPLSELIALFERRLADFWSAVEDEP
jgi:transcriptional regulator with XRE-family HTH domain